MKPSGRVCSSRFKYAASACEEIIAKNFGRVNFELSTPLINAGSNRKTYFLVAPSTSIERVVGEPFVKEVIRAGNSLGIPAPMIM